jgi:hypothetical protein
VKQQMKEQENMQDSFEVFRQNLQNFIDISLLEDETSWMDWIANVSRKTDILHCIAIVILSKHLSKRTKTCIWIKLRGKKPVTKKGRQKRGLHGN